MDFDKQSREGEPCRGVIKKLFPSKRYGFAVCECAKHTGEAHFNYSDLDLPEHERSCLVVGWRIDFNVIEQHKKTDHCDYRAIQVKPVEVMVVQCEVTEVWDNEIAYLTCKELTGKGIYVTRNKYNGKFESDAVTRRDTCRAAVTWEQMKQKKTFALHCSQDTVSPTTGSPYRPKLKTPERRSRRNDGHSFSEPIHATPSPGYTAELLQHRFCDQSDVFPRGGNDSGLVSPEEKQGNSIHSRSFTAVLQALGSTSTPRTDKLGQAFENDRYSVSTRTTPHSAPCNKMYRAGSISSVGSPGNTSSSLNFSHRFQSSILSHSSKTNINFADMKNNSAVSKINDQGGVCSGDSGNSSQPRSSFSSNETYEGNRGFTRRNLEKEFGNHLENPQDRKKQASPSRGSEYSDSNRIMSLLALEEQNHEDENCDNVNPVFGLYDASR